MGTIWAFLAGAFTLLTEIESGEEFTHSWQFTEAKNHIHVTANGSLASTPNALAAGIMTQDVSRVTLISAFSLIANAVSGGNSDVYHSYKIADGSYLNVELSVSVA